MRTHVTDIDREGWG